MEDAIVIKEEAWEDTSEQQREDVGGEYMSDDTATRPGEGGQEDPTSLLMAKDYEGQVHQMPPALPEVVVEALAGPSGMHQVSFMPMHCGYGICLFLKEFSISKLKSRQNFFFCLTVKTLHKRCRCL